MTRDAIAGTVTGLIGAALLGGAMTLPGMPGQQIGPSVFPSVIGVGLMACGFLIAMGIGSGLAGDDEVDIEDDGSGVAAAQPALAVQIVRALLPLALLIFYVLSVKTLGFLIVAALMVFVTALALGARLGPALLLALVASPLTHVVFGKLLRVPLAPGLLPAPW